MTMEEQVPLAPLTTFKIGGNARYFVRARTLDDIREAFTFAKEHALPLYVLGGGSNTLFDDEGFDGMVLKIELQSIETRREDNRTMLIAHAGEWWDDVVARAAYEGWWGIENLSGIPGTIGAAPVQNIGAYGSEISHTLAWVEVLDTSDGEIKTLDRDACELGYRTSVFKKQPGRFVILRVALALSIKGEPNVSYRDLQDFFGEDMPMSPQAVRDAVLAIRARKFPDLSVEGTAGSFFLNPVVSAEKVRAVAQRVPGLPCFEGGDGVKLSLAFLLDKGLNLKGAAVGSARLFEKQPLVLVASHGASSKDVCALMSLVQEKIKSTFDITVEPEVRIVPKNYFSTSSHAHRV